MRENQGVRDKGIKSRKGEGQGERTRARGEGEGGRDKEYTGLRGKG